MLLGDNVCPKRSLRGPCEFTIQRIPALPVETVGDLLDRQRCDPEFRDTRLAYVCIYCGAERKPR